MNPLAPSAADAMGSVIAVLVVVLAIVAIVSLSRCRGLSPRQALLWALLIVLVPVLGPLAWLVAGRRASALG